MFALLSLLACSGDPPAEPAPEAAPAAAPDAAPPAAAAPDAAPATPPPVAAADGTLPPPVAPPAAPAEGTAPLAGRPAPMGYPDAKAANVKLAGTLTYTGNVKGSIRIDVLRNKGVHDMPELADTLVLKSPGPWAFSVPSDAGKLTLMAYIDTNDNGPDASEPSAEPVAVELKGAAVENLVIAVAGPRELVKTLPDGTRISAETSGKSAK